MTETHIEAGAKQVAARLREAGYQSYYAGGCVRDIILGVVPKDFDIVTDATPDQVMKLFRRRVEVGVSFGVVRVMLEDGRDYEIATFRTEGGYSDGRRPDEVKYSKSADEDVHRRDFTINALLMNPETRLVIDHVGGRRDIRDGIIRSVGDPERRFAEDRLRMLRAVRFASRFGFEIEQETSRAIAAHSAEIGAVSAERIVGELHGLWRTDRPAQGLVLLEDLGLLVFVFPFLAATSDEEIRTLERRVQRLPALSLEDEEFFSVCWATHFAPVWETLGPKGVEQQMRQLKLPRAMMRRVDRLLERSHTLLYPDEHRVGDRVRVMLEPSFEVTLGYLLVLVGEEDPRVARWRADKEAFDGHPLPADAILGGADLAELGLPAGPKYKEILSAVELEVYERRLDSRAASLEWVRRNYLD